MLDKPKPGMMRTFTGMYVNPLAPTCNVDDIAHALAHTFRYNGQSPTPLTVAEHSIWVMQRLHTQALRSRSYWSLNYLDLLLLKQGLLHDAHEAYFGDVIAPLKGRILGLAQAEQACQDHVRAQFGVPLDFDPRVKEADEAAYNAELNSLWYGSRKPLSPANAEADWKLHYWKLEAAIIDNRRIKCQTE